MVSDETEQRMARWDAMVWALVATSLRKDVDGLNRQIDEMGIDDSRNAVYVLSMAVADFYSRHARMTGNSPEKLLDEITFVSIERGFAADSPTSGDST
jgi:hypothetical protein